MRKTTLLLSLLFLLAIPLISAQATTAEGVVSVGVLFFVAFMAMAFVIGGLYFFERLRWVGILLLALGFLFFYSASGIASIYLTNISNVLGGEAQVTGLFVFFARLIKYSPYLVGVAIALFVIRWYKNLKKIRANTDGWDNNKF